MCKIDRRSDFTYSDLSWPQTQTQISDLNSEVPDLNSEVPDLNSEVARSELGLELRPEI